MSEKENKGITIENKLDFILKELTSYNPDLFIKNTDKQINIPRLIKVTGVTPHDFRELLTILQSDNYVELFNDDADILENIRITLQGRFFFLKEGGYNRKIILSNSLNVRQRKLEKYLRFLNSTIALGTAIAAWYYLTELCDYYGWTNCFCR